jgi:hypothetical protein
MTVVDDGESQGRRACQLAERRQRDRLVRERSERTHAPGDDHAHRAGARDVDDAGSGLEVPDLGTNAGVGPRDMGMARSCTSPASSRNPRCPETNWRPCAAATRDSPSLIEFSRGSASTARIPLAGTTPGSSLSVR